MRRIMVTIVALVLFFQQVYSTNVKAEGNEALVTAEDAVQLVQNVTSYKLEKQDIDKEGGMYTSTVEDQTIAIGNDNSTSYIQKSALLGDVQVEVVPETEDVATSVVDDTFVVENIEDSYFVTTEFFEGAIRNCFVIEEGCKEEDFDINFSLPEDAHIEFAKDDYDNTIDGSLVFYDKHNEIIGAATVPWAKDANGKELHTYYKINGTKITQHIDYKNQKNIQYPIVADPLYSVGYFFDSAKWITRNGVVSLSLKPNNILRIALITGSASMKQYSWDAIYNKFHKSSKWKNTSSMKKQFYCHWYFAQFKSKFNLEPSRPSVSWPKMIASGCNP